jgi:hypothetical protein
MYSYSIEALTRLDSYASVEYYLGLLSESRASEIRVPEGEWILYIRIEGTGPFRNPLKSNLFILPTYRRKLYQSKITSYLILSSFCKAIICPLVRISESNDYIFVTTSIHWPAL